MSIEIMKNVDSKIENFVKKVIFFIFRCKKAKKAEYSPWDSAVWRPLWAGTGRAPGQTSTNYFLTSLSPLVMLGCYGAAVANSL